MYFLVSRETEFKDQMILTFFYVYRLMISSTKQNGLFFMYSSAFELSGRGMEDISDWIRQNRVEVHRKSLFGGRRGEINSLANTGSLRTSSSKGNQYKPKEKSVFLTTFFHPTFTLFIWGKSGGWLSMIKKNPL